MRFAVISLSLIWLSLSSSWNDEKVIFLFDHLYSCREVEGSLVIDPSVTVTPYGISCVVPSRDYDPNDVPHWTNKEGPVYPPEERHT